MRAGESLIFINKAPATYGAAAARNAPPNAPTADFILSGGDYELSLLCTGTPAMHMDQLGPDGSTWTSLQLTPDANGTPLTPAVAAGIYRVFKLPPGRYRIVVGTSTANYLALTRIPTSE